jgi:hypothetical protein
VNVWGMSVLDLYGGDISMLIGKIGNISHRGDFFMFIPHRRLNKFFYHTFNSSVLISHFVVGC